MMRRSIVLLAALGIAACDGFPTEPPRWEQTWVVPGETVTIGVADFLPAGIELNEAGTAFLMQTDPLGASYTLGDLCPACVPLDGTSAPKPAFTDTLVTVTTLPADLVAAVLSGGALDVTVAHSLSFDPLRPSADAAAERGYMAFALTSDGNVVAFDSISGYDSESPFPGSATLVPSLPILATTVGSTLDLEIRIYSPAGDETAINTADTLGISMAASIVEASAATVEATDITLESTTGQVDFGGVDEGMVERVQSGALRFDIANPFDLSGMLTLSFDLGHTVIHKALDLEPGDANRVLEFPGPEIRDMLSAGTVGLATSGSLSAVDGTVTISPTQELVLDSSFELVILVGALEDN